MSCSQRKPNSAVKFMPRGLPAFLNVKCKRSPVYHSLIIDYFGLKPLKPGQNEDIHGSIAEHYDRTSTINTSNLDYEEWGEVFPTKYSRFPPRIGFGMAPIGLSWTVKATGSHGQIQKNL